MFERILVATDGSADARAAVDLAIRLATRFDSRLSALFVIDARTIEGPAVEVLAPLWGEVSSRPFRTEVQQAWNKRSEAELSWIADRAAAAGCRSVDRIIETGLAEEVILARAASADLVVMGRRGENEGFGRYLFGSTLVRVLRHVPHPVLAVSRPVPSVDPAGSATAPSDLPLVCAVALDGSEPSTRALDLAIRYCAAVGGGLRFVTAGGSDRDPVLESARRLCRDHGVDWESARIDAEPADAVSEAVHRWQADCLFMGAFGHGRLHDLLLGSKTGEILEAVSVPVFLVR